MSEQAQDTPAERGWFWPDEARQILAEIYQQHGHILFTSGTELAVGDLVNHEWFDDASRETLGGLILRIIGRSSYDEFKKYWNLPAEMQPSPRFPFVYRAEILD